MKAGRMLDVRVGMEVMGVLEKDFAYRDGPAYYSTDIAAAWEVLEKMKPAVDAIQLSWTPADDDYPVRWQCCMVVGPNYFGEAETAPLAICLAALKVVEKK